MASKVSFLLKSTSVIALSTRNINCLVAAITKPHRKVYLKQFMTVLQHPDGSTIKIRYHEPIGIIRLPLDLSKLSEKERKAILLERQPTPKKIVDDCEIENTFDENRYLKF
ncbi:PREDICTED: 39S ribosomal protein L55, mitochondrial [Ceratosolen solmsi marchali]|uniref:39S ribosomal protein L55, mitochondrial n=1 Tax=Ceratosolen solmsi marchali TaxID=326594 RepID=A0AAJ6VNF9_9HYME|nr:PREDICTED: 39S ribosomal protein L55, mitochondrial [Ceratosolen solmsi marchali]